MYIIIENCNAGRSLLVKKSTVQMDKINFNIPVSVKTDIEFLAASFSMNISEFMVATCEQLTKKYAGRIRTQKELAKDATTIISSETEPPKTKSKPVKATPSTGKQKRKPTSRKKATVQNEKAGVTYEQATDATDGAGTK